jgi:hypothetical protein
MIIIKCINPKCFAPDGRFEWDERLSLESNGRVAKQGDPGARSFVIDCPYCGTHNKIWLVKMIADPYVRGF